MMSDNHSRLATEGDNGKLGIDSSSWLTGICQVPSTNHNARPQGLVVDCVVLHNISLPPRQFGGQAIMDLFTNQLDCSGHPYYQTLVDLRVSAHALIRRTGACIQFVAFNHRAWHAGQSIWQGRDNVNDFSIGIELEGCDDIPYSNAQYQSLNQLLRLIYQHYPITQLVGHADIAPQRKTDPGQALDWSRLLLPSN